MWIANRIKAELRKYRPMMGEEEAIKIASLKIIADIKFLYNNSKTCVGFFRSLKK